MAVAIKRRPQLLTAAPLVIAAAGLSLIMSACGGGVPSATNGTVTGGVEVATGSTSLRPTHTVVVDLIAAHKVVARDRVARGASFRFSVPPGTYRLDVVGIKSCTGTVRVAARRRRTASVMCTLFRALGSVAFATLSTVGPITTRADALKRLGKRTLDRATRIAATETTWQDFQAVSSKGKTWSATPTGIPRTSPAWAVCVIGGTYLGFTGTSSYTSKCVEFLAKTGGPVADIETHGGWPRWFRRLHPPVSSS